jgi:hypothetical protein
VRLDQIRGDRTRTTSVYTEERAKPQVSTNLT